MQNLRIYLENGTLPAGYSGAEENTKYVLRGKGSALANCIPQTTDTKNFYGFRRRGAATNGSVELVTGSVQVSGRTKPAYYVGGVVSGAYVQTADVSISAFGSEYADSVNWAVDSPQWDPVNNKFVFLIFESFGAVKLVSVDVTTPASPVTTVTNITTAVRGAGSDITASTPVYVTLVQVIAGVPYLHYQVSSSSNIRGLQTLNLNTLANVDGNGGYKPWTSLGIISSGPSYLAPGKGDNLVCNDANGTGTGAEAVNSPNKLSFHIFHPLTGVFATVKPTISFPGSITRAQARGKMQYDAASDSYIGAARLFDASGQRMYIFSAAHPATLSGTQTVAGSLAMYPNTFPGGSTIFEALLHKKSDGVYFVQYSSQALKYHTPVLFSGGVISFGTRTEIANTDGKLTGIDFRLEVYNSTAGYVLRSDFWNLTSGRPYAVSDTGLVSYSSAGYSWQTFSETITINLTGLTFTQLFSALWIPPDSSEETPRPISILVSGLEPSGEALKGNFMLNVDSGAEGHASAPGQAKAKGQMSFVGSSNIDQMAPGCVISGAGRILFFAGE